MGVAASSQAAEAARADVSSVALVVQAGTAVGKAVSTVLQGSQLKAGVAKATGLHAAALHASALSSAASAAQTPVAARAVRGPALATQVAPPPQPADGGVAKALAANNAGPAAAYLAAGAPATGAGASFLDPALERLVHALDQPAKLP